MEKQNIVHLLTVTFIALTTGFVLGFSFGTSPDYEQYTYGSEQIEDSEFSISAYRSPVQNRTERLLAYAETTVAEHGSADDEFVFDMIVPREDSLSMLAKTVQTERGTELRVVPTGFELTNGLYDLVVYIDGKEFTTIVDGTSLLLDEGFSGRIRVDLRDNEGRLVISDEEPVQAFADIF